MPHKNFYKFTAKDNYDLGVQMGAQFSGAAKEFLINAKKDRNWGDKILRSKKFLDYNKQFFPKFVDEMIGYAKGAGVPFDELYVLSLEDELDEEYSEKCTTVITNNSRLFAHNEDWDRESMEGINIVEKTIGDLSIFELYYANTLGGNSVSINSNGFIIGINALVSSDTNMGLSKNVICRWMQETKDPDEDIAKLKTLPRVMGYNYNIVNTHGKIWNVEYSSNHLNLLKPNSPFVHSNHYLSDLSKYEANTNLNGTFDRYNTAQAKMKPQMSTDEIIFLMNDNSVGSKRSVMNERTIAKIIIDTSTRIVKIWLLREDSLGWIDYDLSKYFR